MGWLDNAISWIEALAGFAQADDPVSGASEFTDFIDNADVVIGTDTSDTLAEGRLGPGLEQLFADANAQAAADLDPIQERAQALYDQAANLPGFTDWMKQQDNTMGDTSGIQGLIDSLSGQLGGLDPNSPEAQAYAAEMGGFGSWEERQEFMQTLLDTMENQAGEGMSPEDMALQERAIRRSTAEMERRAERMVADSFSESGSMGRMMLQADESLNQIANTDIQMRAQLAADNRNLAFQQYLAASEQYAQQYQQGSMSATQYVDSKRAAMNDAIAGYTVEMDAIFRENQEYFQQQQADYQALVDSINLTFAAIQTDLGLVMAEYEAAAQLAAQALAPIYTELELMALLDEFQFDWTDVVSLIGDAASIISGLGGG